MFFIFESLIIKLYISLKWFCFINNRGSLIEIIFLFIFSGKAGAYNVIVNTLKNNKTNHAVEKACLKALISLMNKQPDLLNNTGVEIIIYYLKNDDLELKQLVLKWIKECCILHEMNR